MKLFGIKILCSLGLILSVLYLLKCLASPFWGNEIIQDKLNYINSTLTTFDTYFVGSSRVNNQIDCKLFDSATQSKSFNLGCPAFSGFETLKLAHELIDSKSDCYPTLRNIIVELPLLEFNKGMNVTTTRGSYFMDFAELRSSLHYVKSDHLTTKTKTKKALFQTKTAISNLLKLGTFKDLLHSIFVRTSSLSNIRYQKTLGYVPLIVGQENASGIQRRKDFLSDTTVLTQRLNDAKLYIARRKNLSPLNTHLQSELIGLIENGKENNVKVCILLFPKSNGIIYKKALRAYNSIPEKHTINLAKPGKYKEFYQAQYSYDKAHLNQRGSSKLTRYIAEEFLALNSENK